MSCGKPHETPCTEVLERVYGYLDGELGDMDCAKIRQHLDECGPCLPWSLARAFDAIAQIEANGRVLKEALNALARTYADETTSTPMAMRAILAGIKTAAVINVGTATLGALIGAGGGVLSLTAPVLTYSIHAFATA